MNRPRPKLHGVQHLSLTESHLSVEAVAEPQPLEQPSDADSGEETLADQHGQEQERDVQLVHDLEKGGKSEEKPVGEKGGPTPLATDGTPVIVVDWQGSDDPKFPKNWSNRNRMGATFVVASFTFLSPLSSTMIAPATSQLEAKFGITSSVEATMVTSIFVLAYAFGPLFLGPLSELYGRTHVLQLANLLYLIFNLACGFATNTGQMLAFRFLSGLGGSAPLAIGAGVLGDLWRPEERGRAASLYSLGPLLGPAVGPVAGGWIAERLPGDGYKVVFWSTTGFCALIQLIGLRYLKETYAPVLLHRQALALKKEMGLKPDSDRVKTIFEVQQGKKTISHIVTHGLQRPFVMFASEHIIQVLAIYMALIYGIIYLTIVSVTGVFVNVYKENVGVAGTNFVSMGLGFLVTAQVQGRVLDVVYRKLKARYGTEGKPEYRLPMMLPASIFLPFGLLLFGWGAERHLHWIVPNIGLFFIAAGMIGNFQVMNLVLIDTFTIYAASALAAATCLRSLFGFGLPLAGPKLYATLGYGWGTTLLALVSVSISWPAIPILFIYGERIRGNSKYSTKT